MAQGPVFDDPDAPSGRDRARSEGRALDFLDVAVDLGQTMNKIAALQLRAIDRARRDAEARDKAKTPSSRNLAARSFRAEVATALGIAERSAENLIGNASVLIECLPRTLDLLESGAISYRHAVAVVDEASGLDDADRITLESEVLSRATGLTPPQFRRLVRNARERLHPESIEARQVAARSDRGVGLEDERDGMATVWLHTNAAHAHAIFNRLTKASHGLRTEDDTRTLDNRRADIMVSVLLAKENGVPFGFVPNEADSEDFVNWFRGIDAQVIVSVPVLSLLGKSDLPATLDGIVPIDLETARVIVGQAKSFIRILSHPETGATLSVGRKRYKPPRDLRMYLAIRDLICRFPGCSQPAARSDIDHTIEWQDEGHTEHVNLAHLCRGHHTIKGETNWKVTQAPDGSGVLNWVAPSGRKMQTHPAVKFGG
jgi:hypothetical protein